jgi:CheY-like chemotaxis protein
MKRILVVDDEQLLLDLVSHLLSKIGYQVDQAIDCREAAGKLKERGYDAIFLDVKMPFMDGKGFYEKVQAHYPETAKRVIFLTGDIANQSTTEFIQETGNLHLQKPFTIKEFKTVLDRLFQSV